MATFYRKEGRNVHRTLPVTNSSDNILLNTKDRFPFSEVFSSCLTLRAE